MSCNYCWPGNCCGGPNCENQPKILPAGSFRVSDYRKAIPTKVQILCAVRKFSEAFSIGSDGVKCQDKPLAEWVDSLRFDHRPPLQDRPYDTEKGDFDPPQNDPDYIEAIVDKVHDQRTFGRKADAEHTVTTVGSDAHNRSHGKRLRDREALHKARMAMKAGDPKALAETLGVPPREKRKRKIPSRPFPKKQRPLRQSA